MLTTVVLALMMGAFFQAYKSHYSLTRASNASGRASAACDAVYEYVSYRLEHDRTWGSQPFQESGKGDPLGKQLDFKELPDSNAFVGGVETLDAEFQGQVFNNISGAAGTAISSVAAPGTVVCRVSARSGDSTRNAEFVLRIAPLFDSSVLSRANIDVNAERLYLRSRDAHRNLVRAEGDIYIPDVLASADTQFRLPDSTAADNKGMLWSKANIHSYLGVSSAPELLDTADEFRAAADNTNGKVVSGATSDFPIYELDESNLQLPDKNSEVPLQIGGKDKPGRWNFVRRKADVSFKAEFSRTDIFGNTKTAQPPLSGTAWVDVLEYYPPGETEPSEIYRAKNRNEDLVTQTPTEVQISEGLWSSTYRLEEDPKITTTKVVLPQYGNKEAIVLDSNALVFQSADKKAEFTFDLLNQKVTATDNATVTVKGDFELTSSTDEFAAADSIQDTPPPVLELSYKADSTVTGGVAKAAIVAEGTLNIENGVTTGLGALVARKGDVKIQPKNTNTVTVDGGDTGSGLLVFAGGDVVLTNPDKTENWFFKGLVYARNGIRMEGHGKNATFEGTIVSLQENKSPIDGRPNGIEFDDCGQIEFIYNSELLDAYVRNLPGDRIQIETVYWKR